jgi:hypothetical protein
MRKSIPLILLAALLAAPAAFAQDQTKSTGQGYKPSAEASKKRETRITAKFLARRATNQGHPRSRATKPSRPGGRDIATRRRSGDAA